MKLIVGLGNPGIKYEITRHNVGFMFADIYSSEKKCDSYKEKFHGLMTTFSYNDEKIIVFKPLTYMNLSGEAIKEIMDFYKIDIKDLLVIYDDKDLSFGSLRLRYKGNPGTHNGIKNISLMLNSNDFARIRIGIGQPEVMSMVDFVLSKFTHEELVVLKDRFFVVSKAVDLFIRNEFDKAMNLYNKKNNESDN